jgi:nucleotide-binding universal stress UspA family protein
MTAAALRTARVSDHRDTDAPEQQQFERILLASEGRPIPTAAVEKAIELAKRSGAGVHVLSIARVHGVAFALPNPGLLPNKREWAEQREIVAKAIARCKRKGVEATGHVLGTRKATKSVLTEARKHGCNAIVMAADPDKSRFTGDFLWSQEPQRVRRRAKVPVFLVVDSA